VESGFSLVSRCFVWLGGSLFFASLFLIQWRAFFRLWYHRLLTVHVDAVESSKVGTTQVKNPIESTKQYSRGKTNQRLNPMNKLAGPLVRSPDPI
jgi:hypothetical protein